MYQLHFTDSNQTVANYQSACVPRVGEYVMLGKKTWQVQAVKYHYETGDGDNLKEVQVELR